jgi:hypothetical protein
MYKALGSIPYTAKRKNKFRFLIFVPNHCLYMG